MAADPTPNPSAHGERRFEATTRNGTLFWVLQVEGAVVRTRYGRVESPGRRVARTLSTPEEAFHHAEQLVKDKLWKGYREVGVAPPPEDAPPMPSGPSPWNQKPAPMTRREGLESVPKDANALLGVTRMHPVDLPVFLGAVTGDLGMLRQGLTHPDASLHVQYEPLGTPLDFAAAAGQAFACEFLLNRGAYLHPNAGNSSPMHRGARQGNRAVIEVLHAYGASLTRKWRGAEPIEFAINKDNAEAAEALLDLGVDINALHGSTREPRTPLLLAVEKDAWRCLTMLLQRGASAGPPKRLPPPAFLANTPTTVRLLAEAGVDLSTPDARRRRDAWEAYQDDARVLPWMHSSGALSGFGFTALHAAAARRDVPVLRALIAYGANLAAPDSQGNPARVAFDLFRYTYYGDADPEVRTLLALEGEALEQFRHAERARIAASPAEKRRIADP